METAESPVPGQDPPTVSPHSPDPSSTSASDRLPHPCPAGPPVCGQGMKTQGTPERALPRCVGAHLACTSFTPWPITTQLRPPVSSALPGGTGHGPHRPRRGGRGHRDRRRLSGMVGNLQKPPQRPGARVPLCKLCPILRGSESDRESGPGTVPATPLRPSPRVPPVAWPTRTCSADPQWTARVVKKAP